jgi:hypothetical protein
MNFNVVLYGRHLYDSVVEPKTARLRHDLPQYNHFVLGFRDITDNHFLDRPTGTRVEMSCSRTHLFRCRFACHDHHGLRRKPRLGVVETLAAINVIFPLQSQTKAFQPFCRLLKRALQAIHAAYRDGVGGHYGVTWATICRMAGLTVEDVGGYGRYTPPRRLGKHYFRSRLGRSAGVRRFGIGTSCSMVRAMA